VPDLVTPLARHLLGCAEHALARTASDRVTAGQVVVCGYHVALPVFARAKAVGARTVLNYPIAHHRWQYRFYAEEADRNPEFSRALPAFGDVQAHARELDREIELADSILVGSSFAKETFVAQGVPPEKLAVIPYGVDVQRFEPVEPARLHSKPFRVLFVGQIGERKGISYLLKAYAAFKKRDSELHLVGDFVKGGDAYKRFRELFRHTPNLPHAELPSLFRSADVFVFPTLVEGMGLVVLEAMASGVPVIVTPNGPGDIVRDGVDGYVVPSRDSAAVAERLERLYADPALRMEMGKNARAQAERWSWSRYAARAANFVLQQDADAAA
jgi:glycosyltransferase involved in cell wall biosynthesis